ncbi:MAG: hypothetical protein QF618_01365, partial [SAR324 cluster bacterium]|nr:hypothetical protein [SAR324 cluster bacterium]
DQGFEAAIQDNVARHREAQLAAFLSETSAEQSGSSNYWEARTMGSSGELFNEVRDNLLKWSNLSRNTLALVLNAGDGLLLGEFLRHIPEETLYALVDTSQEKQTLSAMFNNPSSGIKPNIAQDSSGNPGAFKIPALGFERIVGRNVLQKHQDKTAYLETLKPWIATEGIIVLAETVPALGQRLSELIPPEILEAKFLKLLKAAEEEIYHATENARSNWSPDTLREELESADWNVKRWQVKEFRTPSMIRTTQIEQWFAVQSVSPHSSYGQLLSANFSADQLNNLEETFQNEVAGKVVEWRSVCLFMELCRKTTNNS